MTCTQQSSDQPEYLVWSDYLLGKIFHANSEDTDLTNAPVTLESELYACLRWVCSFEFSNGHCCLEPFLGWSTCHFCNHTPPTHSEVIFSECFIVVPFRTTFLELKQGLTPIIWLWESGYSPLYILCSHVIFYIFCFFEYNENEKRKCQNKKSNGLFYKST